VFKKTPDFGFIILVSTVKPVRDRSVQLGTTQTGVVAHADSPKYGSIHSGGVANPAGGTWGFGKLGRFVGR
jgi:hypothetical protein